MKQAKKGWLSWCCNPRTLVGFLTPFLYGLYCFKGYLWIFVTITLIFLLMKIFQLMTIILSHLNIIFVNINISWNLFQDMYKQFCILVLSCLAQYHKMDMLFSIFFLSCFKLDCGFVFIHTYIYVCSCNVTLML